MRIAQISPLEESVPPKTYGGTERVISYLTEELVRLGHRVTLFASGDSRSAANLIADCPYALRLDKDCEDKLALHVVQMNSLLERLHDFDIVHFHGQHIHLPIMMMLNKPFLTTLHGRQDIRELKVLYATFQDAPLVSISNAQRGPVPTANWVETVYHGLPPQLLRYQARPGEYLAFLGRISPEKRVDRAIEIAKACGLPLRIAAKVDRADQKYFEATIEPLLDHPLIEYIGEINETQKSDFLGQALALLFPIDWPEPFGLVMIEAMACGTPTIAFNGGSVPEIIRDGVTGFIVNSIEESVEAVQRIASISRERCRQEFLDRFVAERMAQNYVSVYERMIDAASKRTIIPIARGLHVPRFQHL